MFNLVLGDFRFFWPENIKDFIHLPYAWDSILNTGIGQSSLNSLWITSYLDFTASFTKLGLSWNIIGILFWFLPAIFISFFSARFLFGFLFPEGKRAKFMAGFVYAFNTYFLMVFLGGQAGVVLAYSLVPLVLLSFIKIVSLFPLGHTRGEQNSTFLRTSLISGLIFSLELLFDPRFFYMCVLIILFYLLFNPEVLIKNLKIIFIAFLILFTEIIFLHSYWILPLIVFKSQALPAGFDSVSSLRFFSFANFENSISLLHPNWPENIFGKVYFMKPQFLLMPILAYSSLLFLTNLKLKFKTQHLKSNLLTKEISNRKIIIFFASLGLIGAFLAKGANPLFGEIYVYIFKHLPGFSLFRDPTKWYTLVAVSYSVLIPFTVYKIYEWIESQQKFQISNFKFQINSKNKILNLQNLFLAFIVSYLILLLFPVLLGKQAARFKVNAVPEDYVKLKELLINDRAFSRTLWVPEWQRFGYFSNNHPAIGRGEVLEGSASAMIRTLETSYARTLLEDLSVKYVIVPYDSENEIFLNGRKYDEKLYQDVVYSLSKISWLKRVDGFKKIAVFQAFLAKDHLFIEDGGNSENIPARLEYQFINPNKYKVKVFNVKKGNVLVFSEGYDKNWIAKKNSEFIIHNSEFVGGLNSFILPFEGNYELEIYYKPQDGVNFGLLISFLTIICLSVYLILGKRSIFYKIKG